VLEDLGSRNGTLVDGRPITRHGLADGEVIELGNTFLLYREAVPIAAGAPDERFATDAPPGLKTLSWSLAQELDRLRRTARSREPVLVTGETGTGKELIAQAVHELSGRRGARVAVNCGALPEAMVEAELFGHKRGAFSGAVASRPGLVRSADGGTLFLDEIGDLRLGSQAALLRVLQEGEVLPVGDERPVAVDVRLVSATHRDLDAFVAEGHFRADLLARLRGLVVRLPPLRARREDLGIIVADLLRRRLGDAAPRCAFSGPAARALLLHAWAHNVRELDRVLGSALALAEDRPVRLEDLPASMIGGDAPSVPGVTEATAPPAAAPPAAAEAPPDEGGSDDLPFKVRNREQLVRLLVTHQGNVSAVARALGKGRTQVLRWLERYQIDAGHYRP
jgi:transcriptional regulator with GAF, ATPase, and Fis domain